METIISFFATSVEDMILNMLTTIVNIGFIVASGAILYFFILRKLRGRKNEQFVTSGDTKCITAGISACIILFAIYGLYIWSTRTQNAQADRNSWDHFCQLTLMLLDPIFGVSTLATSPLPKHNWTGPNFLFRVFCLWLLDYVIQKAFAFARNSEKEFNTFLEKKIFSFPEGGKEEGDPGAENAGSPGQELPRTGNTSGTDRSGSITGRLETLLKLLPGTGMVGSILAYILGGDDAREAIGDVITAFGNLMNTITLTANISSNASGAAEFFFNFLYIILSICILAIYSVIIAAMVTFVIAAWNKRDMIISWVTKRGSTIFLCVGVTCLILLACTIVFLTGSSFETVREAFWSMFQSHAVFDTVSQFILLILTICVVVLMLGFVIVFSFFIAYLGIQIGKRGRDELKDSRNILFYAKILAAAIIGTGSLLGIRYGYQSLVSGLFLLFPDAPNPSMSLLWVTGHILLLILIVSAALLVAATLIKGMIFARDWLWSQEPKRMLTGDIGPLRTLLQIFVGYSTESEKNRAIFLAAALASLASMLNTFFGLIDFYNDEASVIPLICSLAISGAVQLAMLIFGMKAGEGFAERFMLGIKPPKRNCFWGLAFKVCMIIVCLSALVATGCVVWSSLPWDGGNAPGLNIVLPISFMLLFGTILAFVIIRQGSDIPALWRAWREERKTQNKLGDKDQEKHVLFERTMQSSNSKRLPPYFYLTAYLVLMLVSTGFAFNNLFGYYADQANLHEQVYDQVIDQAGKKLKINQRTAEIVDRYDQNIRRFISTLEARVSTATQKLERDIAILNENVTNQPAGYDKDRAQNLHDRHVGSTRDFSNIVEALKSYISMDASNIKNEAMLTIYKYSHFWGGNSQPSYETTCIVLENNGTTDIIGQKIELERKESVTVITGAGEQTYGLYNRYRDPDSEMSQSIAVTSRQISRVDKYTIIEILLDLFDSQEQMILNYDVESTINSDTTDNPSTLVSENADNGDTTDNPSILVNKNLEAMRRLLAECDTLERVQNNLVNICTDDPTEIATATIHDLPHIVVKYLEYDRADAGDSDKLESYQKISGYIDRMFEVYDILSIADAVLNDLAENETPDNPSLPHPAGEPQAAAVEDESAYTVRAFRNYAQGIAHSNFQISYDALFRGGFGLNQPDSEIDALYRSSAVATFILLICLLVDMMAFFGGLLLFKDIFLFEKNHRLEEIGYINYEALLISMFIPPRGKPIHRLHLALIYRLLYGDPDLIYGDLPGSEKDMEKLHDILNSKDFHTLYDETVNILRYLGIEDNNMPVLQQWLMDFVQKNEIDFDELF